MKILKNHTAYQTYSGSIYLDEEEARKADARERVDAFVKGYPNYNWDQDSREPIVEFICEMASELEDLLAAIRSGADDEEQVDG